VVRGVRLESDGGLGDISGESVRGDSDLPGRDFGELVRSSLYQRGT
jgi:hypothetical protein